VDVHEALDGDAAPAVYKPHLCDGLHLSQSGNTKLFRKVPSSVLLRTAFVCSTKSSGLHHQRPIDHTGAR
jgi:hypothetical protein